ncbi:MAG: AarF/ABC1/UbiB kinase family protein [Proteobacteria bacterium]|nr:AarF/ABC1/UbiB kinase family protein [Pseudomonadota bacterium]
MTKKTSDYSTEISQIAHRLRSAKLVKAGIKTGFKVVESAFSRALGRKSKQKSYEELLEQAIKYFVHEASELKGGIMKAGQLLSMYGEHFFPEEANKILKSLQSDSKPVAFSVMTKKIRRSLGEERFSRLNIDPHPLGAASLGQVYSAKVFQNSAQTGQSQSMAFKVQYPRVASAVESDLVLVKKLMTLLKIFPDAERFDGVYAEIKMMLYKEVDYARELGNFEKYQELLADDPILKVPKVFPEFSTKTVLAMEHIHGRRLDDPVVQGLSQTRRNQFALGLIRLLFREIFHWRVVQTDPHVGNFIVQLTEDGYPQDALYLLDFGAVRKFPVTYINHFRSLALAALENDPVRVLLYGKKIGFMMDSDSEELKNIFCRIVFKAVHPFAEEFAGTCALSGEYASHEFDWSDLSVIHEVSKLARYGVVAFQMRAPPKEAVFIDRKLMGTTTLLKILRAKIGPRRIALEYLKEPPSK